MQDQQDLDPPAGGPEGALASVDWGRYLDAVRRRPWVIAAAVVLSVAVSAVTTLRQQKLYTTGCSIVIETSTPRVLTGVENVVDVGSSGWVPEGFYQTEYLILESRAVARAAGAKLGITNDPARNGLSTIADPAERARAAAALDPADLVAGRYSVEPVRDANLVRIHVVDTDPAFSAALANAVCDAYVELNLEKRTSGSRDAGTWLAVQHADLQRKLEASEDALYAFMADNNVLNASIESQLDEVKRRLNAFNDALAGVEAQRLRSEVDTQALERVRVDPSLIASIDDVRSAPVVTELKARLFALRADQRELASRYQADHPRMRALSDQIVAVERDLDTEVRAILLSIERAGSGVQHVESGLKRALEREREREAHLNKLSLDYARLKREVDTNAKLYDMVTSRMKEADITSALPFNNVRVLDRALVPDGPFKPNLRTNLVMALLFGLLLGVGGVLVLQALDRTLKIEEDVANALGLPFLGLLPLVEPKRDGERGTAPELMLSDDPTSTAAECARFIRTNLTFMSHDRPLRAFAVTSPGPGEGKTTASVSIAISMAQAGQRVLLVDGDMRRPRLHEVFNLPGDVGLSALISGQARLEQAVRRSVVPNLDVLPCGLIPPNPAELFHTTRFAELVGQLTRDYDRVIFDTPPIGPVADPVIVGAQVDGVVLVVESEKTTRDAAQQAIRALRDAQVRLLGAVLNHVNIKDRRYSRVHSLYSGRYRAAEPTRVRAAAE